MNKINQISNDARQRQRFVLPNGEFVSLTIAFRPTQRGWFIEEMIYQDFVLRGYRICTSPNFLYQFKNQIPFGIACYTQDNQEPLLIDDFATDRSELFLLTEADVQAYEDLLSGKTTA